MWPEFDEGISYYTSEAVTKEIKAWKKGTELDPEDFPKSRRLFLNNWEQEVEDRKSRKTKKVTMDEVLYFWSEKGRIAREEGTRIHQLIEDAINGDIDYLEYIDEECVVDATNKVSILLNNTGGYAETEKVIGGVDFQAGKVEIPIAGTVDLCIFRDDNVWLVDWKTNDDIHKDGYNKGLTEATKDYKDSSLFTYTLQLSMYAYLLEKFYNKTIKNLAIGWLNDGNCQMIPIEYRKDLIEKILNEEFKDD